MFFVILVLLAPFGLNAQLTGHSIPDSDSRTIKIMNEWRRFFPVESIKKENKENSQLPSSHSAKTDYLPMMVEVMLGDTKMLYPSALVLVSQPQTGMKSSLNLFFKNHRKIILHTKCKCRCNNEMNYG